MEVSKLSKKHFGSWRRSWRARRWSFRRSSTTGKDQEKVLVATPARPMVPLEEVRPLFSEEQLTALDELQHRAPHLYGGAQRLQGLAEAAPLPRPAFLADEEKKTPLTDGVPRDGPGAGGAALLGGDLPPAVMQMMQQLYADNQKLREEQEAMRKRVEESIIGKSKEEYCTPEGDDLKEKAIDLEAERRHIYSLTPMEQFQRLQEDMSRAQEGHPMSGAIPMPRQVGGATQVPFYTAEKVDIRDKDIARTETEGIFQDTLYDDWGGRRRRLWW